MALACSAVLAPAPRAHAVDAELLSSQPKEPVQPLAKRLQTHDQTELLLSLDELAPGVDTDRNVKAVAELLRAGQPDVVTDHALDALARLGSREAREVVIAFTRHRRPQARRRAYTALAQLKDGRDAGVLTVLTQGIRDSAPEVRGTVARWLGELRVREAAPDLQRALELGVTEAAAALGKLGDAASVERYGGLLGKLPLPVMLTGYANYLERADLPESTKLHIIAVLEDVSGSLVKAFLGERYKTPIKNTTPKLQQAIEASLMRVRATPAPLPAAAKPAKPEGQP